MAMHLTFNKTSPPMQLDDTAQVSAETFDGFKLVFNDVQKRTLDPVATIDADGNDVTVSVYKALVKHHAGVTDWSDGYPQMTGGELAILYNHVLDLLRKNSFDKAKSFRILRMRDACFTPPGSVDAPTTSRDAFAMMVSRAPALPSLLTLITTRRHPSYYPTIRTSRSRSAIGRTSRCATCPRRRTSSPRRPSVAARCEASPSPRAAGVRRNRKATREMEIFTPSGCVVRRRAIASAAPTTRRAPDRPGLAD
jgi:hypothetical protein